MSNARSKTLLAAVLSVMTVGTTLATTTQQAAAFPHGGMHHGHFGHHGWGRGWGWGAGGLALGALGVIAAERAYDCRLIRQYDDYGNYIGRVRVCD